ncbi:MAG: enoyl-CoA hydratase/isomerase family protein, partial [Hyphomicrobiales bacterium]|nr:enoyl-CoA hydratase/isomerase family protein [Hyphomicrobiales bacterium]
MDRSGQGNRMDEGDIARFGELLREVEQDPEIRVLMLRAKGPTFCAGYDLKSLGPESREGPPGFDQMVDVLEHVRVPTIAVLTGGIYGGGTDLALACDFRLGVPEMEFVMPAARFGIHFYHGGLRRYVARLGLGAAKRLFLRGERIGAAELLRIGFLDEVVERKLIEERAEALAALIAVNSPAAVQGMKKALNGLAEGSADFAEIDAAWRRSLQSDDLREGLAA